MAERTSASRSTALATHGCARCAFSSIIRASSSWSSEPQLTPIRTGLPWRAAISIICAKLSSRRVPRPMLPGLMR